MKIDIDVIRHNINIYENVYRDVKIFRDFIDGNSEYHIGKYKFHDLISLNINFNHVIKNPKLRSILIGDTEVGYPELNLFLIQCLHDIKIEIIVEKLYTDAVRKLILRDLDEIIKIVSNIKQDEFDRMLSNGDNGDMFKYIGKSNLYEIAFVYLNNYISLNDIKVCGYIAEKLSSSISNMYLNKIEYIDYNELITNIDNTDKVIDDMINVLYTVDNDIDYEYLSYGFRIKLDKINKGLIERNIKLNKLI